nr:ribonuclease H-like domain-containing protein [Tanacetum cinerariifolium]
NRFLGILLTLSSKLEVMETISRGRKWTPMGDRAWNPYTPMSPPSRENDRDDNQVNNRFKKGEGDHAVHPPYTGNYMPPRADLSFAGLDNSVFESKESDSEDENVFKLKEVKKTVKPSLEKIFVNARNTTVENENKAEKPRKFSQSPRVNKRNWNGLMTQKLGDGFEFKKKACFVCGSINHLIKDCDFYENKMVLNNKGKITAAVLTKSGQVPVNAAKQSSHGVATLVSAARRINTVASRPNVNNALPTTYSYLKAHSPVRRTFNQKSTAKTNNFNEKVNTTKVNKVTIAGLKAVVSAVEENRNNGNPQHALQDQEIFDSGCFRHMTRNKSYLTDYQEIDGGFVAFGGNAK